MKVTLVIIVFLSVYSLFSQEREWGKKSHDEHELTGIGDRAAGIHDTGNIGLYFENRGKLYPRFLFQGPSGEFPINSGKNYIYRINQFVGIPGNVVQGRFYTDEEWEAANGYHNSDNPRIAFSDDPNSWNPQLGWPVKDPQGNNIILSDQDSYCVYSDSNNSVSLLKISIHQTGYVFASDLAEDIIFFKYQVVNNSQTEYDSIYFSLYCDIDVGDVSGDIPEYADDRIGFDKENHFLFFFDDGYSPEWPDSTTGYFGIVFLKTPLTTDLQSGITDFHYNIYDDDIDVDTIQFGIISSSEGLYNSSVGYKYFHPGNTGNIHFDDTSTIPQTGLDIVANISSGPFSLSANQSLIFYTAIIGGIDYNDIYNNMITSINVFNSVLTEVNRESEHTIPVNFELYQNYPNPFNPITKIKYSVPQTSQVQIKVFDVLGNEIEMLVNEENPAGTYEITWSATELPSGVYFYQLRAGSFIETKKMILLK